MDYFKEAEKILSYRKSMELSLDNMNRRKNRLIDSGIPTSQVDLEQARLYVIGETTEDTAEKYLDLISIQKNINYTNALIRKIDRALNHLSAAQRKLLKMWYIDGIQREVICEKLNSKNSISLTSLYHKKNQAMGKFAILFWIKK